MLPVKGSFVTKVSRTSGGAETLIWLCEVCALMYGMDVVGDA